MTLSKVEEKVLSVDQEAFEKLHSLTHKKEDVKRIAIIASKGTLDMAYPPLILATTAASMGMECAIFCTFYGLNIVRTKKHKSLQVAPLANPAAPLPVPNILGAIPGATPLATWFMRRLMAKQNMPKLEELIATAQSMGVKLVACSTTMGVMGVKEKDLIPNVSIEGAAAFLEYASKAQVTLFI